MVITVNDYKEIRKRYLNGESQRSIAKSLGISRNTVSRYCEGNFVPWKRKRPERAPTVLTEETVSFILSCLEEDVREGLKKQKHTAKRIYDRLVEEKGFSGGESTIRRKVRELKGMMPEAFIPLAFDPGDAMQVDWGEAKVYIDDVKTTVNLFCARLCHSCKAIILAYHRQNEESFLDAFVRTFEILGGVPKRVIFDNARVAVKDGFGAHAKKQEGYSALSAHYGFDAIFCNPHEGHEKGLVEGLVGWARRNVMVPVPKVRDIRGLNELLLERCDAYERHTVNGRPASVGEMYKAEKELLRPLPGYKFETAKTRDVRVSAMSTVTFATNSYSVPIGYSGTYVGVKGYPETVEIYHGGELIASHDRCFGKNQKLYRLEHYMPALEKKGRAILDAAPVKQNVPVEVYEELKASGSDHSRMVRILREFLDDNEPRIKDTVKIRDVDLRAYDCLGRGDRDGRIA